MKKNHGQWIDVEVDFSEFDGEVLDWIEKNAAEQNVTREAYLMALIGEEYRREKAVKYLRQK